MSQSALWTLFHDSVGDSVVRKPGTVQKLLHEESLRHEDIGILGRRYPDIPLDAWQRFANLRTDTQIERRAEYLETHGIRVLTPADHAYPPLLCDIYQPPAFLYVKGTMATDALSIGVVGSRRATHYGLEVAQRLSAALSGDGVVVVSGLARGIDGRAHTGALEGPGGTIAVLGTGIDVIYPRDNTRLYASILEHPQGAILSEAPLGALALPYRFPLRNRIIAGLSRGLLVVEAAAKSGALITATSAMENGRDVFAVPGLITSPVSAGCHRLIRDGAILVTDASDILQEYGQGSLFQSHSTPLKMPEIPLSTDEKKVYRLLTAVPQSVEELVLHSGLGVEVVTAALSWLEINGLAAQMVGRLFIKQHYS